MAIQSTRAQINAQQLDYLGLGPRKRQQVARTTLRETETETETETEDDADEAPKKKGSMLPILAGAAAVVFLMAQK